MPDLLIIDANNLAFRVAYNRTQLSWQDKNVSVTFGFLKSLSTLLNRFPRHFPVLIWDKGHFRRDEESKKGVASGIIPETYKANRHKTEPDEQQQAVFEQIEELREDFLPHIHALQAEALGYEADDLACAYSKMNEREGNETILVTSDKDYYQLLAPKTKIIDCMKNQTFTSDWFFETFGFLPRLWVDCGALMGDNGDNIFGVPGIGEKTACKLIREHGSYLGVIDAMKAKNKRKKFEQAIIDHEERVRLAYSLKKMDEDVKGLPKLRCPYGDLKKLEELFEGHGFESLVPVAYKFCKMA